MQWKSLEQRIRDISALVFGKHGEKDEINGVNLDCVVKLDQGQWIIVEVSKERKLEKVRTDVLRLVMVRRTLFDNRNILAKCYFVCLFEPTTAMIQAGAEHHITVISQLAYEKQFFDYSAYLAARTQRQFGSSVHPLTGSPDDTKYISVKYEFETLGKEYDIPNIAKLINSGGMIVLTGEYGSGKSRCLREVFFELTRAEKYSAYLFAIDLKMTWGLQTGEEIVRRHFDSLGLSTLADFAIRAFHNGNVKLLLDGFDEVGSQAWSDDPATLKQIRRDSLRGVRDLIRNSGGGILVAGREHYFNSNEEMMSCLGMEASTAVVGKCKQEFDEEQLEAFLNAITREVVVVPEWLPRRPLMCQAIASLKDEELKILLQDQHGDIGFWNAFIDILCKREARIREILEESTIKSILMYLARLTRSKGLNVGPISYSEIQDAFEFVLGTHPVEEASVILQRLPGLGRTSRESDDRQFIDTYIVDGLRALDLAGSVSNFDFGLSREVWTNPLQHLGQRVFASEIEQHQLEDDALKYAQQVSQGPNNTCAADIVSGLLLLDRESVDFLSIVIQEADIAYFDLSHVDAQNLRLDSCIIMNLVFPSRPITTVEISNCQIDKAYGVAGPQGVPDWTTNTEITAFESVATVAAIKNINLSPQHRVLVTILKKTFFQPGGGRQEGALLRGLGQVDRHGYTDNILKMLISEGLLKKARGKHGNLYVPERKHTDRVAKLLGKLNLSEDPLWQRLV